MFKTSDLKGRFVGFGQVCQKMTAQHLEPNSKTAFFLLLAFSTFTYTLLYFNRSVTDVGGFDAYAVALMREGEVPYRDFFYYVPPLYLFRNYLVYGLVGNETIPFRLIGLLERIGMYVLLYYLMCRWIKPRNAYIAAFCGFLFFNSFRINSYGDYTQFSLLLLLIGTYCAVRSSEALKEEEAVTPYLWSFAAGFVELQSVMTKQNIGLGGLVAIGIGLLVFAAVVDRDKILTVLLSYAAGLLTALVPYCAWLSLNGATDAFIEQVVVGSANAKGAVTQGAQGGTVAVALNAVLSKSGLVLSISTCSLFFLKARRAEGLPLGSAWRICKWASLLLFLTSSCYVLRIDLLVVNIAHALIIVHKSLYFWVFAVAIVSIIYCIHRFNEKEKFTPRTSEVVLDLGMVVGGIICFISWVVVSQISPEQLDKLYELISFDLFGSRLMKEAFFFLIGAFFGDLASRIALKRQFVDLATYYLVAASIASSFVSLVGSGTGTFAASGSVFSVSTAIMMTVSYFCASFQHQEAPHSIPIVSPLAAQMCFIGFIAFVCATTMLDKFYSPYSFYGWRAEELTDAANYAIDVPGYEGMRVNKLDKKVIEEIYKLIDMNTGYDDSVYVFAQGKTHNVLTNRLKHDTFGLIHYFDVCPDNISKQDAEVLRDNPPAMIVWKEYEEPVWEYYERTYRGGGRLGQRDILDWFNRIRETDYTLVGHVYNEDIYLRNDLGPAKYTSFVTREDSISDYEEVKDNVRKMHPAAALSQRVLNDTVPLFAMVFVVCVLTGCGMAGLGWGWSAITLALLSLGFCLNLSFVFEFIFLIIPWAVWVFRMEKTDAWVFNAWVVSLVSALPLLACFQWGGNDIWAPFELLLKAAYMSLFGLLLLSGVSAFCKKRIEDIRLFLDWV